MLNIPDCATVAVAASPNPVLTVTPQGGLLYANDAAKAVKGLLTGRKKGRLPSKLAKVAAEVSRMGVAQTPEFRSGDHIFALAMTPVAGESCINIYGHDITDEHLAKQELLAARASTAAAEAQLRDAVDHMSEGFVLYDSDDRLQLCNSKFRDFYNYEEVDVVPGTKYEDLVRLDFERGVIADENGQRRNYTDRRIAYRKEERGSFEVKLADGRWILIHERSTSAGGRVGVQADITERKRAEQELAEKEAQLEIALDNMPGGMKLVDQDLNYVLFNSRYSELCDYPDGLIKVGGSMLDELRFQAERGDYGPGDAAEAMEEVLAFYRKGEAARWERTLTNGRTVEVHVAPTPEGGYVNILTDVTERKRAEEALRDSREQLHAVIDAVPAMISAKDRNSRYLFINRYQAELYGVSRDEAIGKTAVNLLGRKYGAYTRRLDRKVIESGEALPYFEEDHTDAQGGHRELLATKVPLKDRHDCVQGVVTVALDISDRKRAGQALKESETRFVQAARLANLGHWAWDEIADRCTYCSEELARIHGFGVDEYLAATNSLEGDLALIHPDDRDEYYRVTRKWANQQDTYDVEYRVIRPDGEVRHVRELAEAVRDGTGRMVRSFGTLQDITERKRAEEELLEAKRRTEEANNLVIEKNRMLESLSNQLSKYLSPQVYASIFSGEQSVEIASKRKKLTVFFSDIADFTGTTDSLESEELTDLLNHYLTEMSKVALDHGATIDKYVGDAIIAFFGDPESRGAKEDAIACVEMAIAMQRRLRELQSEWLDMGLERPFQVRMGINTGFCTVGNFGSGDRMDYTIIGNEVNLASRLEAHAEAGGILLAHETHALVKDRVLAEEGDTLTVKGFAKPVRTYRVVGHYDDLAEQGRIIRKEKDGIRVLVELNKGDKAAAIEAVEDVLSQLKE